MKFLQRIFGKKKEEEVLEETQPTPITTHGGVRCEFCKDEIKDYEKRKRLSKEVYHIKCLRKAKKIAKKQIRK